jgi:hypothetical protein
VGKHKERGNEGEYGGCILDPYMKIEEVNPIEIVLLKTGREGGKGRMMEWVNISKIYCKHICKYHNVFPCTTMLC